MGKNKKIIVKIVLLLLIMITLDNGMAVTGGTCTSYSYLSWLHSGIGWRCSSDGHTFTTESNCCQHCGCIVGGLVTAAASCNEKFQCGNDCESDALGCAVCCDRDSDCAGCGAADHWICVSKAGFKRGICQFMEETQNRPNPIRINEADYISIKVNGGSAASKECSETNTCSLSDIKQQDCCWAEGNCAGGGIPGYYIATSSVSCTVYPDEENRGSGGDNQIPSGSPYTMFECLAETEECESDQECAKLPGATQGHCTRGNSQGDTFCRPSDPWCGDQYCDDSQLENCPGSTRRTDIKSCPNDPVCKYYVCEEGCSTRDLPAGDYSSTTSLDSYPQTPNPYSQDEWTCNYGDDCSHCDGDGECVTSCIDNDEDGYGIQPNPLFHSDCCGAGSTTVDCDDSNITTLFGGDPFYIHPADGNSLEPPSPYCDCNNNDGFGQGAAEGPINLALPISQDLCFDGIDNDCDGPNDPLDPLSKIDCKDLGCSPNNWYSPIRNRTCAGDCASAYQTENNYDRACCPAASNCILQGRCVESAKTDGVFPNVHYCAMGSWHGGDYHQSVCNIVVNDTNYPTSTYSHWNRTGNAGNGKCCGDDPNEYFIQGLFGEYACCNSPDMKVLGGVCLDTLTEKKTWDNLATGYCLGINDCLVNPNINSFAAGVQNATNMNNPSSNPVRCIHDQEFIGDRYCNQGEWTTRTALVATQLMDFADSNDIQEKSMYCDNYQNVLNYYNYEVAGSYAENYLGMQGYQCLLKTTSVPCTNNVCVLKYKQGSNENIIIGTSLNQPANAQMYSILEVLGGEKDDCNIQINSSDFTYCGTGVWYNNKVRSVIFSKDSLSLSNVMVGSWLNKFRGLFGGSIGYISQRTTGSYNFNFARDTHNFNKIYLSSQGSKTITIITEETNGKKYMSVNYKGFNTDICSLVNQYKTNNAQLVPLECTVYSGDTYILTGGASAGYYNLLDDLGPKLRLS